MSEENPFRIIGDDKIKQIDTADFNSDDIVKKIQSIIASDDLVLFMKGNSDFPQCGFSANTVAILKHLGSSFTTFDILTDMDVRQGLKEYSNWPTYPQLYFKQKLIGGNDIITEMFENGELKELLQS